MKQYYRSYAEIDLDAIVHNIREFRKLIPASTNLMAVVKADGYGHGAVPVAKAVDPEVDFYGVALVEEGVILRQHGITKPILVLGVVPVMQYDLLFQYQITPTIFQLDKAKLLSALAIEKNQQLSVHLAVDTGMSRIGVYPDQAAAALAAEIAQLPNLELEGIFTHFAKADEPDKSNCKQQLDQFTGFIELLEKNNIVIPIKHSANSAGLLDLPEAGMDMVRAGIAMYGLFPSDGIVNQTTVLKPALQLCSHITYLKEIQPGMSVSYGGIFTADRPLKVATIPIGYGDGYPRNQSGQGAVLISGRRAPILGRVCMDQLMVDVTQIPEVQEGDKVILIGTDQSETITVEELAKTGSGFHYEILCNISKRIPRVYIKNKQIIGTIDYFSDRYQDF